MKTCNGLTASWPGNGTASSKAPRLTKQAGLPTGVRKAFPPNPLINKSLVAIALPLGRRSAPPLRVSIRWGSTTKQIGGQNTDRHL
jgi:hypothetical protein